MASLDEFLTNPQHGWESEEAGPFTLWHWAGEGPPQWSGYHGISGVPRAFQGLPPGISPEVIITALKKATAYLDKAEIPLPAAQTIPVLLWDARFPLPDSPELGKAVNLHCPLTWLDGTRVIALPVWRNELRGKAQERCIRSAALHEAFHALIWDWLDAVFPAEEDPAGQARFRHWRKFDEMCATALEYRLASRNGAWLDFGRTWLGALALSHCDGDQSLNLRAAAQMANFEDYGHFPLLAWMDETVWPAIGGQHWLHQTWGVLKEKGWEGDPWVGLDTALQPAGGLAGVFRKYAKDAWFPAHGRNVIAQIHREFGPPPAVGLGAGMAERQFAVGKMGVQYFRVTASGAKGEVVRIRHRPGFANQPGPAIEVRAFSPEGSELEELKSGEKPVREKNGREVRSKVWEVPLSTLKSSEELIVSVCLPQFGLGGAVFHAAVVKAG